MRCAGSTIILPYDLASRYPGTGKHGLPRWWREQRSPELLPWKGIVAIPLPKGRTVAPSIFRALAIDRFVGFVGAELGKLGGRHGHQNAANVGEPRPDLRIGETRIDLLVELVDHVGRRARRCADPWRLTGHSAKVNVTPDEPDTLVSRFRSSPEFAARSRANFGIKGTLATL